MNIRQLRHFVTVADEGNLGRAALRLHLSQPPLTRQIQQIERQIGVPLFVRTPKGVALTAAGRFFLEGARSIIDLMDQTVERAQRAGQGQVGRFDVGIFGSGVLGLIPRLLQTFGDSYPGVRIVLHTMNRNEQLEALRQRRIDIGFNRLMPQVQDLAVELVKREELLIAIRHDDPLASADRLSLLQLADSPLIVFPAGSRPNFIDYVYDIYKAVGLHPNVKQEVGDAATGVALVAGGLGFCLVPESTTNLQIPGVLYRRIDHTPKLTVDLSCIYRRDERNPILSAFLEIVRAFRRDREVEVSADSPAEKG